jgi:hypothetical protein
VSKLYFLENSAFPEKQLTMGKSLPRLWEGIGWEVCALEFLTRFGSKIFSAIWNFSFLLVFFSFPFSILVLKS